MTTIRWGVLGTAGIARHAVIPGIRASASGVVAAIASRDQAKAERTAAELDIPKAYGSYEALLADADIDAVYIPLPNHLHKEWTVKAAAAGKHVLCEKPIALNAAEAQEMADACRQAGVELAEAFMYRHHPRYPMIKQLIRDGAIGDIRGIHGAFTFSNPHDKGNVRYRKEWGGGSLYDVGCYPINAARYILEREPEAATCRAFFSPEHDDVDMMASGLIEFPDGVALTFDCGMWAHGRNTLEIVGSEGRIVVPSAYVAGTGGAAGFIVYDKSGSREVDVPAVNQYAVQADDFAARIHGGQGLRFEPDDAVANMKVIDACLASARRRERISLVQEEETVR